MVYSFAWLHQSWKSQFPDISRFSMTVGNLINAYSHHFSHTATSNTSVCVHGTGNRVRKR